MLLTKTLLAIHKTTAIANIFRPARQGDEDGREIGASCIFMECMQEFLGIPGGALAGAEFETHQADSQSSQILGIVLLLDHAWQPGWQNEIQILGLVK